MNTSPDAHDQGDVKLLSPLQPHLRTPTYTQTYPSAQRATHLKSVLVRV
jgi:hypothetical protein